MCLISFFPAVTNEVHLAWFADPPVVTLVYWNVFEPGQWIESSHGSATLFKVRRVPTSLDLTRILRLRIPPNRAARAQGTSANHLRFVDMNCFCCWIAMELSKFDTHTYTLAMKKMWARRGDRWWARHNPNYKRKTRAFLSRPSQSLVAISKIQQKLFIQYVVINSASIA